MKGTNWEAVAMPMVFWAVPAAEWTDNPRIVEGMEAEVLLPNGQTVVVDNVRYQGLNYGKHHWQGMMSQNGKPRQEVK